MTYIAFKFDNLWIIFYINHKVWTISSVG